MTREIEVEDYDDIYEYNCENQPLIGQKLPEMELEAYYEEKQPAFAKATAGWQKINTKDYRGKWLVLIFYPADFTFICPTELEEAADLYDQFKKEGAEVISVSTDSVYVHKAWRDQSPAIKKIKFPMAADRAGKLARALGVYLEDKGEALRGSFIIDPDGIIKTMEIHDNNIGRSGVELLRKLQAAKFAYETKGAEVCPANWYPGEKTIKISR